LGEFLGGDTNLSTISGGDSLAGYKLKESGSVHWRNQNPRTTNETGFTFLPGGKRLSSMNNNKGAFNALGSFGYMWSSTEMNEQYGCFWGMYNHNGYVGNGSDTDRKDLGISVRCIKDLPDTGPKIRMIKIKR
ncbi:MAG: FISUMP domain-containing protein, partial [Bacteroidales bacterium]|nr:FISUMP domain-containing protein [Bacteroidales bacterium]